MTFPGHGKLKSRFASSGMPGESGPWTFGTNAHGFPKSNVRLMEVQ